jgi:hypothetical protein
MVILGAMSTNLTTSRLVLHSISSIISINFKLLNLYWYETPFHHFNSPNSIAFLFKVV